MLVEYEKDIVSELKKLNVHTIILYGSRARGDYNSHSDVDVIGFRDKGDSFRIARFDKKHQLFFDIFVENFKEFNDSYFKLLGGKVLIEKEGFGAKLLRKVELESLAPTVLPESELEVRRVWYQKMLQRALDSDIEGLYRHQWALHVLIEDYFAFRGKRYLGPKNGFHYLYKYDKEIYDAYQNALQNANNIEMLKILVNLIVN